MEAVGIAPNSCDITRADSNAIDQLQKKFPGRLNAVVEEIGSISVATPIGIFYTYVKVRDRQRKYLTLTNNNKGEKLEIGGQVLLQRRLNGKHPETLIAETIYQKTLIPRPGMFFFPFRPVGFKLFDIL